MAPHVNGKLYYECMGRAGPVIAFIHPNPMDQSCWIYQLAHLSTWFRCISIDIPGYGRSPTAEPGLTMDDMAEACWEAIDDAYPGETCILTGCSTGSRIAPFMYHQRPEKTAALVVCGTGYTAVSDVGVRRSKQYRDRGIDFRWGYTLEDFSGPFSGDAYGVKFFCRSVQPAEIPVCRCRLDHLPVRGASTCHCRKNITRRSAVL